MFVAKEIQIKSNNIHENIFFVYRRARLERSKYHMNIDVLKRHTVKVS